MTIYDLKTRFQDLLRPVCGLLANKGFTPNQLTLAALLLSLFGGFIVYAASGQRFLLIWIPAILFTRMALNALDGMLAREFDMQSPLGAILNEISDVLSDVFIYLPFALYLELEPFLVIAFVLLSILVEMMGVISVQIGSSRRYDGPMGKSDRAFMIGLLSMLLAFDAINGFWMNTLFTTAVLLSIITLFKRAIGALAEQ
jgi:CDP-diacylglycerol--glycerol-3-phosphate 3-phosphatidyltransferase